MTRWEINRALEIRVPQRIPQVSRFAEVLGEARVTKEVRRSVGRKRVRRGVPFSVWAAGWNW
jgi:hypothetical protein